MKYAIVQSGQVVNVVLWDGDEGSPAAGQEDWQPFSQLAWPGCSAVLVADGGEVSPGWAYANGEFLAPQTPPVIELPAPSAPRAVTMRQARLALLGAGKLADVDAAIDSLPSPQKEGAQIEWEYAATVDRDSPLMAMVGAALNLSEADLDDLFTAAAAL